MTPQQRVFAAYFATWGLCLPDEAVAGRTGGALAAAGWSVRFRWREDAGLLFRAGHRMTNERLEIIAPDGVLSSVEPAPPAEFMVFPEDATDEDKARVEADYHAAWSRHQESITAAGLDFDRSPIPADLRVGPRDQLWRLDRGVWQLSRLREVE